MVSQVLRAEVSLVLEPKKVSLSPEQRCPFDRGNIYKNYVSIFPGVNFVSPEWSCPKGGVPRYFFLGVSRDTSGCFGQQEGVRTACELFNFSQNLAVKHCG